MSETGTELKVAEPQASYGLVTKSTLDQMKSMAADYFKSGLCPKKFENPEQIVITALFGRELGLSFNQAITAVHVIEGIPSLHYKDQLALIRARCPQAKIKFLQKDATGCVIEAWRPGEDGPTTFSFTMEDAKRAGLLATRNGEMIKDNWRYYPEDMCIGRAVSRMGRGLFSDIMRGFGYTPDELRDQPLTRDEAPTKPQSTGTVPPVPKKARPTIPAQEPEEAQIVEEKAPEPADRTLEHPDFLNQEAVVSLVSDLNNANDIPEMELIYGKWRSRYADQEVTLVQGYMAFNKAKENFAKKQPA